MARIVYEEMLQLLGVGEYKLKHPDTTLPYQAKIREVDRAMCWQEDGEI